MKAANRRPTRFLITLTLSLLVPIGLAAQQHQHQRSNDSAGAHHGQMMGNGDTWMEMMSMMPGGNTMMGAPMGSLMQRVMRLQPAFVLMYRDVLSLTGEQIIQFEQLVVAQEAAHQEQMRAMLEDSQSLAELFDSDNADVEEIRMLAEGAMRPFRALQWRAITDARAVRALLTPTQREKAGSLPLGGSMMMRPQH